MVESIGAWWMWAGFFAIILAMIAADLLLLGGRTAHKVSFREAAGWSMVWVAASLVFDGMLWWYLDTSAGREIANQKALEFLTGYMIEKALALDNIFVWLLIFNYFEVPAQYQRRVLLYGVLVAIVMRTIMVVAGVWLLSEFHWLLYLFGLMLVVTGIKMLIFANKPPDLWNNPALRWMRTHMTVTETYHDELFFVVREGIRYATPLFLVLVLVEITDLIFALDSIPAILAVTSDPFIVLTSNVFAILGLRAMYFLLKDMADRFRFLEYGLAMILIFVGAKMLVVDFFKIPVLLSLAVVGVIITLSVVVSLGWTKVPPSHKK